MCTGVGAWIKAPKIWEIPEYFEQGWIVTGKWFFRNQMDAVYDGKVRKEGEDGNPFLLKARRLSRYDVTRSYSRPTLRYGISLILSHCSFGIARDISLISSSTTCAINSNRLTLRKIPRNPTNSPIFVLQSHPVVHAEGAPG
jgi:hypothetical protein